MNLRKYIKNHGLPFKLYKENGTEIVLLELEDEDKFIDKLELIEKIIMKSLYLEMCYGLSLEIDFTQDLNEIYDSLVEFGEEDG